MAWVKLPSLWCLHLLGQACHCRWERGSWMEPGSKYFAKRKTKQQARVNLNELLDTRMINKAAHSSLQLLPAACQITSTSAVVQDRDPLIIYWIRASCWCLGKVSKTWTKSEPYTRWSWHLFCLHCAKVPCLPERNSTWNTFYWVWMLKKLQEVIPDTHTHQTTHQNWSPQTRLRAPKLTPVP